MDFTENEVSFKWTTKISGIAENVWNNIYGDSILNSYNFFKSMDLSDFENVSFSYLVIYTKGEISCIVPCFTYLLDIHHISSSEAIKKIIRGVRKLFPGFFKIKAFVIGSYVSTCEDHIGILKGLPRHIVPKVKDIVNKEIKKRAREEKSSLMPLAGQLVLQVHCIPEAA